jgi:hypothetical protein
LNSSTNDPPPFVKPNRPARPDPPPPRKKRDARQDQARWREALTRTLDHALERCPDCNYQLRGHSIDYTRQVIELPEPPPIEIIEHRIIKRFCPVCRHWCIRSSICAA